MSVRYCKFCSVEHPLTPEFWRRLEYSPRCRAYDRLSNKLRYETDPQKQLEATRRWNRSNPEKRRELTRQHANRPESKAKQRNKHRNNVEYRLARILRSRMSTAMRYNLKVGSAVRDLGCSVSDLQKHLESQFAPGMSWHNYGTVWHIDHILPLANYQLSDRGTFRRLAHYTNLQPLWAADNISKSNKE